MAISTPKLKFLDITNVIARAHFSEMPPIFKNIEVSREDIGSFMGKYVDEHKLLSQPLSYVDRKFHR